MILAAALIAIQTPKPEEVWAKVLESYGKAKSLDIKFTTTLNARKQPLYTGKLTFAKDKTLKFSLRDSLEKCESGYTWTKQDGASTWVSPPELRGYNDTLTARHPYFLVNLLEGKLDPKTWAETVTVTRVAGQKVWVLFDEDRTTYTVNASTYRLLAFSGPELYDEERKCTTNLKH